MRNFHYDANYHLVSPERPDGLMTRIGLVGCASAKLDRPAPARELYTSSLFRKAAAYAEATCDRWFILSALHGLVHPDAVLDPYDVKLGRGKPQDPAVWGWADQVNGQLEESLADIDHPLLVTLAGDQYRIFLHYSAWPFEVPMRGLGIGEQLAWLTQRLAAEGAERPTAGHVQPDIFELLEVSA